MSLFLTGCSFKEEAEPVPDLYSKYETVQLETVSIGTIGHYSGFMQETAYSAVIHPHCNLEESVTVTEVMLSSNNWWEGIVEDFSDSIVILKYEGYTIFTAPNGVTYGYMPINKELAVIAYTSELPSSYVRLVMDKVCLIDS